jgi:hypothetical protein
MSMPWAIKYVPPWALTDELIDAAIAISGTVLGRIPPGFITPPRCVAAVSGWGPALAYVPGHMRTAEVCAAAFAGTDVASLADVPEFLRSFEMCVKAVGANSGEHNFVPVEFFDNDMICAVVRATQERERRESAPGGGRVRRRWPGARPRGAEPALVRPAAPHPPTDALCGGPRPTLSVVAPGRRSLWWPPTDALW